MWKKVLTLSAIVLILFLLLPNAVHAAEECPYDHSDKKNLAFIGCTDMKCFYCDYVWENANNFHKYEDIDFYYEKCLNCGDIHCKHPFYTYISCNVAQCDSCSEVFMTSVAQHKFRYEGYHAICTVCGYATGSHRGSCIGYTCDICGVYVEPNGTHQYQKGRVGSCAVQYVCSRCGREKIEIKHDYIVQTVNCQLMKCCKHCDHQIAITEARHTFKPSGDRYVCVNCGYVQPNAKHTHSGSQFAGFVFCRECLRLYFVPLSFDLASLLLLSGLVFIVLVFVFASRMRGGQPKKSLRFRKRVPDLSEPASLYWSTFSNEPDIVPDLDEE